MRVQYEISKCDEIEVECDREILNDLVHEGAVVTLINDFVDENLTFADTILVDVRGLDKDDVIMCMHYMLVGLSSADEIDEVEGDVYRFWWD